MFGFGPMSGWYGEDLETGRGTGGGGGGGSGGGEGCGAFYNGVFCLPSIEFYV